MAARIGDQVVDETDRQGVNGSLSRMEAEPWLRSTGSGCSRPLA